MKTETLEVVEDWAWYLCLCVVAGLTIGTSAF